MDRFGVTNFPGRRASLLVAAALLVVACGGGSGPAPITTAAPADGAGQPPTQAPAGNGGQGIADLCLNTVEEVEAALAADVAEAVGTENPGFGGGCLYNAPDGSLVYAIGIVPVTDTDLLTAARGTEGAVDVPGIGDGAVLVSDQGPLVARKGNWLISIGSGPDVAIFNDAGAYRAALEQLARAAVGRL